ncbi:uncharacterized protein LMH87_007850 [Akanthomyces muscarius]|uniref:Uncharacterized protein n=1 Tax=Akanthomyces muscarius TaxID=2231603 RepID=A0A9W8UR77_AKAMU|nr:uncharacterized protein LMH87_007850 [Akanthomyces muscarius]KAJ4159914.1 hypothetical protein LMH87_007850 [Akanthomyces muscarius]
MSFTFVTSTGAGQSPSAAKKVRGHVTRVVFAQRRADRAQAQDRGHSGTTKQKFQAKRKAAVKNRGETQASANGAISNVSIPLAPCHKSAEILEEFWSIILSGHDGGGGADLEYASWREMLASEPAFLEATMAAAMNYWCASNLKSRAQKHREKAVDMMIDRIKNHQLHTDGFLGAALTMAVSERLLGTEQNWQMHIRGITGAVQARRQRGIKGLSATFDDLMVLDGPNEVFGFPRVFHSDIIRELTLDSSSNQAVLTIASMAKDVAYLRQLRNQSPDSVAQANKVPLRASEAWLRVSIKCHVLRTHQNPFVRSTAKAMELILNMTCPPQPIGRATELAAQLKEALSELPGRSWDVPLKRPDSNKQKKSVANLAKQIWLSSVARQEE